MQQAVGGERPQEASQLYSERRERWQIRLNWGSGGEAEVTVRHSSDIGKVIYNISHKIFS